MDDVAAWFLALYKATGIKLTIFYDGYDRGRFVAPADLPPGRLAACIASDAAGHDQQPGQPGEDDHARLRHRGAGIGLYVRADLVGASQCAGDDGGAAGLLCSHGRRHQSIHAMARGAAARAGIRTMRTALPSPAAR